MALKVFVGFDVSLVGGQTTAPTKWSEIAKPPGVCLRDGIATQNPNLPLTFDANNVGSGRHANSSAWGPLKYGSIYSYENTDGGWMVGINRATHSIGNEVWITADIKFGANSGDHTSTNTTQGGPWDKYWMFRWGDLSMLVKSITWSGSAYFTAVLSIRNNGTEVATLTIPEIYPIVVTGPGSASEDRSSDWLYMTIHAKLDGSAGMIDVNVGGYSQSVAYTGQNTVQSLGLGSTGTLYSADNIYVGYPSILYIALYDGDHHANLGRIDNLAVFDEGFPATRPNAFRGGTGTSETSTGWSAVGTALSTIRNALSTPTDAKAARGYEEGAALIVSLDEGISGSGFSDDILGVNIFLKNVTKRDTQDIRVAAGLSTSGVHTMGTKASAVELPLDTPTLPPSTLHQMEGVWEGIYESGLTFTDLPATGVRLVVEVVP